MKNYMESKNLSPTALKVSNLIASETSRAIKGAQGELFLKYYGQPLTIDELQQACREYLDIESEQPIIPDQALENFQDYIKQDSKLKLHFPSGCRLYVIAVPCNAKGLEFSDLEKQNFRYIRPFIINNQDMTIYGITPEESHHFEIFPLEIQNLPPVIIPNYVSSLEDNPAATDQDRQNILKAFEQAFKASQFIFNKALNPKFN